MRNKNGHTKNILVISGFILITIILVVFWPVIQLNKADESDESAVQSNSASGSQDEVTFRVSAIWHGANSSSTSYESSDGKLIWLSANTYRSAAKAHKKLEEILGSGKIIERGPKMDKGGQQVGERIVAIILSDDGDEGMVSVLWTYNSVVWSIKSSSMEHALRFEKFHIERSE